MKKNCIICNAEYTSSATKRNRRGRCRVCVNASLREIYYEKNKDTGGGFKYRELLAQGKKKCTKCNQIKDINFFSKHITGGAHRASCKDCNSISYKKYEKNNKERINANRRNRRKDPIRGIIFSQRDRQRMLFKQKGVYKNQPCTQLIRDWMGCTVDDCRIYIEKLFIHGMSWENKGVGKNKWQIDHKIPISLTQIDNNGNIINNLFNRKIWHYTNLQPLWHTENAKKSNKYNYVT